MDLIRKSFKDNASGETITIADIYKNVAITNTREKIDTHRLLDPRYYTPLDSIKTSSYTAPVNENRITNNIALTEEIVDPNKFFSPTTTYNAFAEKISAFPLDKIPYDDDIPVVTTTNNVNMPANQNNNPFYPSTNESAILPYDPQDEIEELKAKYGASIVDKDAVARQNEYLNKIANGEPVENINSNQNVNHVVEQEPAVVRINADTHQEIPRVPSSNIENPVNTLFKGVKRVVDFDIELKLNNKIPRLDFIEMVEDSYESSIIDYLAEELTNNLLNNPSLIKDQISSKIRSMVAEVSKKVEVKEVVEKKPIEKKPIDKKAPVKRTPRVSKKEKVIK